MRVYDQAKIDAALSYPALVDVLADGFRADITAPARHHHDIPLPGRPEATLLLMPAWQIAQAADHGAGRGSGRDGASHGARKDPGGETAKSAPAGGYIGIKTIAVIPDNGGRGLAAVQGSYLLLSALTGQPLAMMDAPRLTNWRTAAASALASRYLSRANSSKLLMVGAGGLAPFLIRAHASVRPITHVTIWNRTSEAAHACATALGDEAFAVDVSDDLEAAVQEADIISVATLSAEPLIHGAWLQPGVHLDTVGAFRPDMRETDDEVLRRARLFVDTRAGALREAGDIVQPLNAGVITKDAIIADLFDLTAQKIAGRGSGDNGRSGDSGRSSDNEITYFKSVGASLEDLATAIAIYEGPA